MPDCRDVNRVSVVVPLNLNLLNVKEEVEGGKPKCWISGNYVKSFYKSNVDTEYKSYIIALSLK